MSDPRTLAPWLRRFLAEHVVTERNLARNTQKSYRDTFALLLPFVGTGTRKPVDRLAVQDLTARRVLQFLAHVEVDCGCSAQTRNQRLTAIRAFARFVVSRNPGQLEWSANIRAITLKKATPQPIGWIAKTEMKALLEVPDRRTPLALSGGADEVASFNSDDLELGIAAKGLTGSTGAGEGDWRLDLSSDGKSRCCPTSARRTGS